WTSVAGGAAFLVDEVPANTNYYSHTGVENITEYNYFIRAVFGDFTSTSCTKSISTGSFTKPDSVYLANANVLPDNNIELTLNIDLKPQSCTWEILRSDAGGGQHSLLTTLSRNDITSSPYIFLDETADGSTGFYIYSINVFDSCEALVLQSNDMKTIFLEGQQLTDDENYLSWNAMEGYEGGVGSYLIYRMTGGVIPEQPIDSTDAQTTEYSDNISSVSLSESKFEYWVQAVEGNHNNYGIKEKCNSNIISLFRETDMYFPNAFRPDGINNEFKPVFSGFGGSNYLLQIYNRWGQLIFETSDPEQGWDGKYKGNPSSHGTYIYILTYQNVFDITKQRQGAVTLIE
ncbi:MAG: gliding motility-associated C-terminal domain-containing protein, partial [Bacteroidetes bacterium]|nr:gliding motility-associated C-terminal domain-containing protein [Bacteroidota bacterium]